VRARAFPFSLSLFLFFLKCLCFIASCYRSKTFRSSYPYLFHRGGGGGVVVVSYITRYIYFLVGKREREREREKYSCLSLCSPAVELANPSCEKPPTDFFQITNKPSLFQSIPPSPFPHSHFHSSLCLSQSAPLPHSFRSSSRSFFRHGFNRPDPPRPHGSLAGDSARLFWQIKDNARREIDTGGTPLHPREQRGGGLSR